MVDFSIDSGSDVSYISLDDLRRCGLEHLVDEAYRGRPRIKYRQGTLAGHVNLEVKFKQNVTVKYGFDVTVGRIHTMLGLNFLEDFDVSVDYSRNLWICLWKK